MDDTPIADVKMETDVVVPHQLCSCCAKLIEEADCLKQHNADLSPSEPHRELGTDGYYRPYLIVHPTYPSLQYIKDSGESGCHLCSLWIGSAIFSRKELISTKQMYTTIQGLPSSGWCLAQFKLKLHAADVPPKAPNWRHKLPRKTTKLKICRVLHQCSWGPTRHPACWSTHTLSDQHFEMVLQWLNDCQYKHSACESNIRWQAPTRLLDVSSPEEGVRLIPGNQHHTKQYATLSYRWDSCTDFVLRRGNITRFEEEVPLSSLPKTFRDAVYVCQKLGIRYLWSKSCSVNAKMVVVNQDT